MSSEIEYISTNGSGSSEDLIAHSAAGMSINGS
jgi:hypothetical protein